MKTKYRYIELEEGIILMGYSIPREKAMSLINRYCKKDWGDIVTENAVDLIPIYELTTIEKDQGKTSYSWKDKPESSNSRVLGWAFQI